MFSLQDKVAVVTGGASGIGEATARRFAEAGAKVAIGDLRDASDTAKEIGGLALRADVSREAEVENLLESALREFGRLDIVVNNAGVGAGDFLARLSRAGPRRTLAVNLKGTVWGIKHAASRISDGGSIMSTASVAGLTGTPSYGAYVASKAAIIGITKTARSSWRRVGVRVNCVCPGTIDTPMMPRTTRARSSTAWRACCTRSAGWEPPEEVAALFHFLASDESAFITGQAIAIDGGMSAGPGLGMIGALFEKIAGEAMDVPGDEG